MPICGEGTSAGSECRRVRFGMRYLRTGMSEALDEARLRRLVEIGGQVSAALDVETVLNRVLNAARELTGARYAALGVLDEGKRELERFLTVGIDDQTHQEIGDLPRGRGILGILIQEPTPLRL